MSCLCKFVEEVLPLLLEVMSTIKYHMLPPCGTKPAWRQALAGRPAIAGYSPMLPRCGTNLTWRQGYRQNPPGSAFPPAVLAHRRGRSVGTFYLARRSTAKTAPLAPPPAPAVTRHLSRPPMLAAPTERPHEVVNPCNCNTCNTCNNCNHILSHKLATVDFARFWPPCVRHSSPFAVLQTVPKSSTTHRRPPALL
jgi:hypothetical protein